jgi:hypothetical protein
VRSFVVLLLQRKSRGRNHSVSYFNHCELSTRSRFPDENVGFLQAIFFFFFFFLIFSLGMRVLTLSVPVLGLLVGAFCLWEYYRHQELKLSVSVLGLIFVEVAYLLLLLFFAIDPGSINAKLGGYVRCAFFFLNSSFFPFWLV